MTDEAQDREIRQAAFAWLEQLRELHGDEDGNLVQHFNYLRRGFEYQGQNVSLCSNPGIFRPKRMCWPLTIRTSADNPYQDSFDEDGDQLEYAYYGGESDRDHQSNRGLREACERRVPLIHLHGIGDAMYVVAWPVFIIRDNYRERTFTVDMSPAADINELSRRHADMDTPSRRYTERSYRARLHQTLFRKQVLTAYRRRCALCSLKHEELLEAAHIIPDRETAGVPEVRNGLSLCNLHHTAFDRNIIGIRPDYHVKIRPDILEEEDGPMLVHGLQAMENKKIILPRHRKDRPDQDRLEQRYEKFERQTG